MILDTSAILAIVFAEPDRFAYEAAIEAATTCTVSAVSCVEAALVVEGRKGEAGREALAEFWDVTGAQVMAVTPDQATLAIDAFRRFGKGRHRAGLNLGDCFSYALARATGEPLLYKGNDFLHTDVVAALA